MASEYDKQKYGSKTKKYHGWANYDTYLVQLWLFDGDERNYRVIQRFKSRLLKAKKNDFIKIIRGLNYGADTNKINWRNVRISGLKEAIRELA